MEKTIIDPVVPYVGPLPGAILPGKFVRILGSAARIGTKFFCNLQSGPNNFDDVALHILVNLSQATVTTKSQQLGTWQEEDTFKSFQIQRGTQFEILIICEATVFKIGINGQHLCEFPHKIPYYRATYIKVDGDLSISQISVESEPTALHLDRRSANMSSPPPAYSSPNQPPYPTPNQPPYPTPNQAPYPTPNQAPYPQPAPTHQVPFNSGQQGAVYVNPNSYPPGQYVHNPLIQQQPMGVGGPVNATPRPYQPQPFFSRRYYGSRKGIYIGLGLFVAFALTGLTIFLIMFFKSQRAFEEVEKRQEEFRFKNFGDSW